MKTPRLMAVSMDIFHSLLATRKELMEFARSLGSAAEMRAGINDIMASSQLLRTPTKAEEVAKSYQIDADGAAHIPIVGVLTPKADDSPCAAFDQGAETEYGYIIAATRAAEADERVQAIAYDINSGGGYVEGVDEAAQVINSATKPTSANVGNLCASAAYWLASQTDKIQATSPVAKFGSIGVAAEEYDDTEALKAEGIAHRVYTSTDAPNKRPDTSTEEGQKQIVADLDATHKVFVDRVAHGRHTTAAKVSANFGKGGILIASEALKAGMIDSIQGEQLKDRTPAVAGNSVKAEKPTQEVQVMDPKDLTLAALKELRPDLVAAAEKSGASAEAARVAELTKQRGINAAIDKIVDEAIVTGATYAEMQPRIVAAAAHVAQENPPAVGTATGQNGSGPSAEAQAMGASMGLTAEDFAKFGKKEGK